MARKTVFVSDFSSKEIGDEKQSATVTVRFGDGRRGVIVADAHVDDRIVQDIAKAGRQQARRGRRGLAEVSADRPAGDDQTLQIGPEPRARTPEPESQARKHQHMVGSGRT